MTTESTITLTNSLTRAKERFTPLDASNVRLYACGPTVYDRPHIGNARAVVVYDVLFRLLRYVYGEAHVTYARNITDVDDKIITAAKQRGISIQALTQEVTAQFHSDMDTLNCLRPTHEPRATEYIPHMIAMIEKLITNGHAYESQGHVLFAVTSGQASDVRCQDTQPLIPNPLPPTPKPWHYGMLSGRKLDDLIAGARVEVESYKRHPGDFVLWKPADEEDDESSVFQSPWGKGRPGWHIECSAMSTDLLGETFDIHGGGADLKFPHHENEIAQSCCANPGSEFAKCWVHNGFLTVNGEKMSKSLGNFITVKDLLDRFEAQGKLHKAGEIIRYVLLSASYSEPLNWTDKLLDDAEKVLDGWYRQFADSPVDASLPKQYIAALCDDMNVSKAFSLLHQAPVESGKSMAQLLGFLQQDADLWFKGAASDNDAEIDALIQARIDAKKARDFAKADDIRKNLEDQGIILEDKRDGTTDWRRA